MYRIKQLEWEEFEYVWQSNTPHGYSYIVEKMVDSRACRWQQGSTKMLGYHTDIEEAKAVCQKDFEEEVSKNLEPVVHVTNWEQEWEDFIESFNVETK